MQAIYPILFIYLIYIFISNSPEAQIDATYQQPVVLLNNGNGSTPGDWSDFSTFRNYTVVYSCSLGSDDETDAMEQCGAAMDIFSERTGLQVREVETSDDVENT